MNEYLTVVSLLLICVLLLKITDALDGINDTIKAKGIVQMLVKDDNIKVQKGDADEILNSNLNL